MRKKVHLSKHKKKPKKFGNLTISKYSLQQETSYTQYDKEKKLECSITLLALQKNNKKLLCFSCITNFGLRIFPVSCYFCFVN